MFPNPPPFSRKSFACALRAAYRGYAAPRLAWFSLPILRGPLGGQRWIVAAGGKPLLVLFGRYEERQAREVCRRVSTGSVFYDLGAHHGYYTLLAARLTGPTGRVVAVEPDPANFYFLQRHVRLNGCRHVRLVRAAVGGRRGFTGWQEGTGSGTGRVKAAAAGKIRLVRVDDLVAGGVPLPTHLKIDVEGEEGRVLRGARNTLAKARPVIFLSTHGDAVRRACERLLAGLGYRFGPWGDGQTADLLCLPG